MLSVRPEGPTAGRGSLGKGTEPPPHQLGVWGSAASSPSWVRAETFEFGAFWDLKIASKECHVSMKLYEMV